MRALLLRGGAVWQLVGLITRRSQVQILPPLPTLARSPSEQMHEGSSELPARHRALEPGGFRRRTSLSIDRALSGLPSGPSAIFRDCGGARSM